MRVVHHACWLFLTEMSAKFHVRSSRSGGLILPHKKGRRASETGAAPMGGPEVQWRNVSIRIVNVMSCSTSFIHKPEKNSSRRFLYLCVCLYDASTGNSPELSSPLPVQRALCRASNEIWANSICGFHLRMLVQFKWELGATIKERKRKRLWPISHACRHCNAILCSLVIWHFQ